MLAGWPYFRERATPEQCQAMLVGRAAGPFGPCVTAVTILNQATVRIVLASGSLTISLDFDNVTVGLILFLLAFMSCWRSCRHFDGTGPPLSE